jgi:hypothetical protein
LHAFAYRTNVQRGIELLEKALAQAKYGQDLKQQAHLLSHVMNRLFILLPEPEQPEQPDH